MDTALTISTTANPSQLLVTLHLPMNNGQQILLAMVQNKGQDSLRSIQAELIRQARMVLDAIDPPDTP